MQQTTPAYAHLDNEELTIGNALIERRWRIANGQLVATLLLDRISGRQWAASPAPEGLPISTFSLSAWRHQTPTSAEFLRCELTGPDATWRFDIFDDVPAITIQLLRPAGNAATQGPAQEVHTTGIEAQPQSSTPSPSIDLADCLALDPLHCDFTAVEMAEQTDARENLVFERRWMLHPAESHARASGNIFFLEHRATGRGIAIVKHAPAPYARPLRSALDCGVRDGILRLWGHGLDEQGGEGYPHTLLLYSGGRTGRTAILQQFQHRLRVYREGLDGAFLSNTWGDRNRDAAISESFLLQEIEAGSRLGVDVVQIDDGWQKGRSANSATKGGVWSGFWAADPDFWCANPQRLPHGLSPILHALQQKGMSLGLWYAPDSTTDCANWQRDARQILSLSREHGVRHIKIDAVKMHSTLAQANVARFYNMVMGELDGQICFDSDVTAEVRPGFWGQLSAGPIFVENRYTDWHRYWPHHTLRNLWLLAHYIPPVRLRMEFLNHLRNQDKYTGDHLAPAKWPADTLFATVMFASPLGWFETSRLSDDFIAKVAPLVQIWKQHRRAIHTSTTIPIGHEPDGFSWTGLRTLRPEGTEYAVVFNELAQEKEFTIPTLGRRFTQAHLLHGEAQVRCEAGQVVVRMATALRHALICME